MSDEHGEATAAKFSKKKMMRADGCQEGGHDRPSRQGLYKVWKTWRTVKWVAPELEKASSFSWRMNARVTPRQSRGSRARFKLTQEGGLAWWQKRKQSSLGGRSLGKNV